ncbi:hypothetical protein VTN02DRAFT_4844 [Thermoascus thermophilus]
MSMEGFSVFSSSPKDNVVTIVVDTREDVRGFNIHRNLLASCSSVFSTMFKRRSFKRASTSYDLLLPHRR